MKLIPILSLLLFAVCNCSNTILSNGKSIRPPVYDIDYAPVEQNDLEVSDHRSLPDLPPLITEEKLYNDSLNRISDTLEREEFNLEMTKEIFGNPSKPLRDMFHEYCQRDVLLDSRGGHHTKWYCTNPQLQNPKKKFKP